MALENHGLIPFGMSGLKSSLHQLHFVAQKVSSRLGWVDWNLDGQLDHRILIPVSSRLGWVDWNNIFWMKVWKLERSHPVWDEWIEIQQHCAWFANPASHPVWDEWIEIFTSSSIRISSRCLIPFGMSGLKSGTDRWPWSCLWSHPVWDEWIEIAFNMDKADFIGVSSRLGWVDWNLHVFTSFIKVYQSHPVWDEWIEIAMMPMEKVWCTSHPVWDEWIEIE